MNQELEIKLHSKYPTLITNGINVGDGWYNILDILFKSFISYLKELEQNSVGTPSIQIWDIKEKFGGLRIYYTTSSEEPTLEIVIYRLVSMAEQLSMRTCEDCGKPGEIINQNGWYRTQCNEHKMAKALDAPPEFLNQPLDIDNGN